MQKITLILIVLLGLSASSKAEEKTVWEGSEAISWNNEVAPGTQFETPEDIFRGLEADQVVRIYTTTTYENPQYVVTYKKGDSWDWTDIETTFSEGILSFTVADNTQATEIADRGLILRGQAWTATKITVETEDEVGSTTELWSGSFDLGDFKNFESLRYDGKGKLANAKVGDDIIVTFNKATDGCQIYVCDAGSYAEFANGYFTPAANEESASIAFTITDANVLESIQEKGIVVKGKLATLTKIELATYATSYDAVSVTITDAGIATFSSSKHLSFKGTGVTPYYASEVNTGVVYLTSTTTTWSWQGYILRGDAGTYSIPVIKESQASYPGDTNYLQQCVNESTVTASNSGTYHYILAKDGENTPSFYKLESAHTLGAKKAYLETTSDITPTGNEAKGLTIVFDDITTDLSAINTPLTHSNNIFSLSGMVVSKPTRGMYIVNGHKVIVR